MISPQQEPALPQDEPSLIAEVRAIRRTIVTEYGHDVDRICDHLQGVEREYRARLGRFSKMARSADDVVAGWGDEVNDIGDPTIDELRAVRAQIAKEHRLT